MKLLLLIFALFVFNRLAFAQEKKLPTNYRIEAEMNDSSLCLKGKLYLTYQNNTKATINEIFFHLYENAYQPESYYHKLNVAHHKPVKFGKNEAQKLGTLCQNILVNGKAVGVELDNTILKIKLNQALLPDESLSVEMDFQTYYDDKGSMRRRNKMYQAWGQKHFNGTHWYPILAVFDDKGWHTDQNLDKEFYAHFGNFDVKLTFPNDYILEATGVLQNEKEVLPDSLLKKIDLQNFANKPFNEKPSIVTKRDGKKTWHYQAQSVHNFAYTASPAYRRKLVKIGDIDLIILAKEPNASKWQQTPALVQYLVNWYNKKIGQYPYPKLVVADAAEGFECGMMALVGGQYPYHVPLIAHEIVHQWFQGAVANDERNHAFLDEGFAEFMTVRALEILTGGQTQERRHENKFMQKGMKPYSQRFSRIYYPYLYYRWTGFDAPLNTFSSDFNNGIGHEGGYGLTYQKGALMLLQLEQIIGEQKFEEALKLYFQEWKFKNPTPADFQATVAMVCPNDLNWFFEQWFYSTKFIDYSILKIKKSTDEKNLYNYAISFKRKGTAQAPITVEAEGESGKLYRFYIPNSYAGHETQTQKLPVWYGFGDKLKPIYEAKLQFAEKIKRFEIDPDGILPDVRRGNNRWEKRILPRYEWYRPIQNPPSYMRSTHIFYPDFWYNRIDGVQAGVHLRGNYLEDVWQYRTSIWLNTRLLNLEDIDETTFFSPLSFKFVTNGKWSASMPKFGYYFENQFNNGMFDQKMGVNYTFRYNDPNQIEYFVCSFGHKLIVNSKNNPYSLMPALWSGKTQSLLEISGTAFIGKNKIKTIIKNDIRTPFFAGETDYSWWQGDWQTRFKGKKLMLAVRALVRVGFGEQIPESGIYLYGDNPEGMATSRLTRARITMPERELRFDGRLLPYHQGGGLNVRGFTGYSFNAENGLFWGRSGYGFNTEFDFADLIRFKPNKIKNHLHIDTYAFADAAQIVYGKQQQFAANFGLGIAFHCKTDENDKSPFIFRIDSPFWISEPYPDGKNWRFRYVFGVGRAF